MRVVIETIRHMLSENAGIGTVAVIALLVVGYALYIIGMLVE